MSLVLLAYGKYRRLEFKSIRALCVRSAYRPVTPGYVSLFKEIKPFLRFLNKDRSFAGVISRTPFCYEDTDPILICGDYFITKFLSVGACIEMACITDIIAFDRVFGSNIYILAPCGSTDDDDVIRIILSYGSDNFFCIGLDRTVPSNRDRVVFKCIAVRLIADLVKDIGIIAIYSRYSGEEISP